MIEKVINKIENNEKIFVKVNEDVIEDFINKINVENFSGSFIKYLTNCTVKTFYEYETENILIRFNNINDIIRTKLR